ncbi:MAG: glycerol-3-phosphate 1-O-acyltransferase [Clostridia bacterium]|nr:glycerol-3-phosphate 1-O-acyltransferase [Clostridia bacterium]
MNELILPLLLIASCGYLLGSINSAILVSRGLKGQDIRQFGSGNAGVTNMYRVYGRIPALLTVLGDFGKAALAVLSARLIFSLFRMDLDFDPGYLSGLLALVGHIFPIYFGLRGGKGVMPLIGVLCLVNWPALLIVAVITVPLVLLTRRMSLGSVVGSLALPFVTWGLASIKNQDPLAITGFVTAYAILVLVAHQGNIQRLIQGTEQPFSAKKS